VSEGAVGAPSSEGAVFGRGGKPVSEDAVGASSSEGGAVADAVGAPPSEPPAVDLPS
jgi:hypothetical protein